MNASADVSTDFSPEYSAFELLALEATLTAIWHKYKQRTLVFGPVVQGLVLQVCAVFACTEMDMDMGMEMGMEMCRCG